MFRNTEKRLIILTVALVVITAGVVWLFASGLTAWGVLAAVAALALLVALLRSYKRFNRSVLFLLGALENGDYSFRFAESTREKRDVNTTLNAVKSLLVRARESEIEHERFLSIVVESIPTGIVIVDERDFVRVANAAALRLLGMTVLTHVRQLDPAVRRALDGLRTTVRVADERDERQVSVGVSRLTSPTGELRLVTMQNIAGELQEQEMESWMRLVRVMTHEIMNSIAPITSLSETMLAAWESGGDLRRDTVDAFATITATARGLLEFVESYRRFAGVAKPALERVALVPLVENTAKLMQGGATHLNQFPRAGRPQISIIAPDPAVAAWVDAGQIGQVLLNLFKNATEAGATRIDVRVAPAGGGAMLEVEDNGTPIPEDVAPQIFVPFFTTKAEGTGVGLSISRHIMRLHGGNLTHRTEGGRTVFALEFGE